MLAPVLLLAQNARDSRVGQLVNALEPKLIEMRRDFHRHPELSNREERTGKTIAERLRALKFDEVRYPVARHGIVAVLKGGKPGPVVAWRADIDALPINETIDVPYKSQNPGVKHACGHDAHITVGLGIAEVLAGMRADIAGTVVFFFQPAEEGPPEGEAGGATLMIKEGALASPRPQAIFAFHTSPFVDAGSIGYVEGPTLASSDTFEIKFSGKRAHGSAPHLGNDAIVTASQCILALQTIHSRRIDTTQPSVLTIGTIDGGDRHNVIAERVRLTGTLRTFNEQVRESIRGMMRQTLTGCASAFGAQFELNWTLTPNPVTVSEPGAVRFAVPVIGRVLGQGKAVAAKPVMAAEDFSYFLKEMPGAMLWLGIRNESRGITAGWHTADFDIDEVALPTGVKVGTALLLDWLEKNK